MESNAHPDSTTEWVARYGCRTNWPQWNKSAEVQGRVVVVVEGAVYSPGQDKGKYYSSLPTSAPFAHVTPSSEAVTAVTGFVALSTSATPLHDVVVG